MVSKGNHPKMALFQVSAMNAMKAMMTMKAMKA
jgi:hypothetical protein